MLVLFIALLLLVLVVVAFSGNDDRRRDSYRRRSRYDDYDPYHQPQFPYPSYIEPVWGRSRWEYGGGGKSVYGFVALVALGLLGYYVFANNGPGLNKDGPTRETYISGLISSDLMSAENSTTKSDFPREQTLLDVSSGESTPTKIYTIDIHGKPANDLVNEYEYADQPKRLEGDVYIQTGSFSLLSGARTEQDRLLNLLDKPVLIHLDQTYGTEFKLLVGPFDSRDAASAYKKRNLSPAHFVKELPASELNLVN